MSQSAIQSDPRKSLRVWLCKTFPQAFGKLRGIVSTLSQQKVEKELSPRNMWAWFLSNRINPNKRILSTEIAGLDWKEQRQDYVQKGHRSQKFHWQEASWKNSAAGTYYLSWKGRMMAQRVAPIAKMAESRAMENYSQAWKPSQGPSAWLDFKTAVNQGLLHTTPSTFCFVELEHRSVLGLPHCCMLVVLRSEDLALQVHGSTDEENLYLRNHAQGACPTPRPHLDGFWILNWCSPIQ